MDYHDTWIAIIGCRTPSEAVIESEIDPTVRSEVERWVAGCVDIAKSHGLEVDDDDLAEWAEAATDELCAAFGGTMLADGSWAVTDAAGGIWHPSVPMFDKDAAIRVALREPGKGEWSC